MSWGEIYNTSWWGVALDTARTVKARPDFFGSQLNLLTSEQPNLVVNGTFDTDSDWSLGTGWSISGGAAVSVAGTSSKLEQQISGLNGKTCKVSLTLSNYGGSGSMYVDFGNVNSSLINTNGEHILYGTFSQNELELFKGGAFSGSIDNVSVQVVRAELDQIEAKKCLADWIHTTALKDLNN